MGSCYDFIAKNSGKALEYLVDLGVLFARREDGRLAQFVTDGSEYARACYTGPYTANHIEEALVKEDESKDLDSRYAVFMAGAAILAKGGAEQVVKVNVFTHEFTGDGYAAAFRVGAELVNIEFIQMGGAQCLYGFQC